LHHGANIIVLIGNDQLALFVDRIPFSIEGGKG